MIDRFKNYHLTYLAFLLVISSAIYGQEKPAASQVILPPATEESIY